MNPAARRIIRTDRNTGPIDPETAMSILQAAARSQRRAPMVMDMNPDIIKAAKELIRCVEFDVNGSGGKGGNGGLTSNDTIRAAGNLRVQLDRMERETKE